MALAGRAGRAGEGDGDDDRWLPWDDWYRAWGRTGRPIDEFWRLSPAQTMQIFEGLLEEAQAAAGKAPKKRGTKDDLMRFAAAAGGTVRIRKEAGGTDA